MGIMRLSIDRVPQKNPCWVFSTVNLLFYENRELPLNLQIGQSCDSNRDEIELISALSHYSMCAQALKMHRKFCVIFILLIVLSSFRLIRSMLRLIRQFLPLTIPIVSPSLLTL